ncbi:hypothetical protein VMCG_03357 [Cytospora schulzeri]|uniref:Nephrocystin 3-like N-terminal domain-containing protein n=1 Tax=Cytospora schulzeri TaxID=448051 RepID=A0A423WWH3_9PEZI|nr:hypothetical protein VMCG_03357 [Valsa malicola]
MADPLSIIASSIAVIQAADAIISLCKGYVESFRDAPSDISRVLLEVSALKDIFENLKFLDEHGNVGSSPMLLGILGQDGPVQGCQRCVTAIQVELVSHTTGATEEPKKHHDWLSEGPSRLALRLGKKGNKPVKQQQEAGRGLSGLKWPLKKGKVMKLLDEVKGYKDTITLAICSENMGDTKHMKKQVQEVHEQLSSSKIHEICDWLVATDPSTLYITSRDQYTEGTGNWVLRSIEWNNWINGDFRSLWIHGIPGAGKTVLAGYLIHEIQKICDKADDDRIATTYYYCYHGNNQDERVPMLKWVVSQLSRTSKSVAPPLLRAYEQGRQPSVEDLLNFLEGCLEQFTVVYLVIDALDESQQTKNLLQTIKDLVTEPRFNKIQLLTTSREYRDIERILKDISTELPMSNGLVEEDIRVHVTHKLRTEQRFEKWPMELFEEVEEALTKGAQGMFRWAVCQIDILRRKRSASTQDIHEALRTLPKTLDETYERIFSLIEPDDQDLVRHGLAWICFQSRLMDQNLVTPPILIESFYRAQKNKLCLEVHSRFTRDDLQDMFGCLLIFEPSKPMGLEHETVRLAHYTVREYLSSVSILESPAAVYALKYPSDDEFFLHLIFEIAKRSGRYWDLTTNQVFEDFISDIEAHCVYATVHAIVRYEIEICRSKNLTILVFDSLCSFLTPRWTHLGVAEDFSAPAQRFPVGYTNFNFDHSAKDQVGAACLVFLFYLSAYDLAEEILNVLRDRGALQRILGTTVSAEVYYNPDELHHLLWGLHILSTPLLDLIAQVGSLKGYELLLQKNHDAGAANRALVLSLGYHSHKKETGGRCRLQVALQAGADPNTRGVWATPLQIAVARRDLDGVQCLVEAGADVNGLGDDAAEMWGETILMGRFNFLHDLSPLYICKIPDAYLGLFPDFDDMGDEEEKGIGRGWYQAIEILSVEYGGDPVSTMVFRGLDASIGPQGLTSSVCDGITVQWGGEVVWLNALGVARLLDRIDNVPRDMVRSSIVEVAMWVPSLGMPGNPGGM